MDSNSDDFVHQGKEDYQEDSGNLETSFWDQEIVEWERESGGRMEKSESMEKLIETDEEDDDDSQGIRRLFHPKLRKHWKTVLVAALLLLFGLAFLVGGILIIVAANTKYKNTEGPNGYIFFVCAGICLVPGVSGFIPLAVATARGGVPAEKGYTFVPSYQHSLPCCVYRQSNERAQGLYNG